jgi:DNA-binding MarR family transcriptional regulator
MTPQGCTNFKARQFTRLAMRHYEAYFTQSALKITQYSLLSSVLLRGPLGAGELAAAMRLSPSALSRNLQPLLAHGWVEISAGDDARSRVVAATDAGRAVRIEGQRAWKRAQLALNQRLGAGRVAALHTMLDECSELLAGADDAPGT